MISSTSDATNAPQTNERDASATYEHIVDTCYEGTYRYARSLAYNEADAQDLTQHAFLKLRTHFHQIRDFDRVKGWLFSTVRRKFLNGWRHQNKFPKVTLEATDSHHDPSTPSGEVQLDAQKALAGLQQLPERFRTPLALYYLEHHSYKEISKYLEVPIGTVMSRLSRAKRQLRDWVEGTPSAEVAV